MSGRLGFDRENSRFFFSDGKDLVIVNSDSGERVGVIPKVRSVSDIAFAPDPPRAFIVDSDSRTLIILDLKALTVVQKTNAGTESSSVLYDAAAKDAFTTSSVSSSCRVFDAVSGKQQGVVKLRGYPRRAVGDSHGHIYFELTSTNPGNAPVRGALGVMNAVPMSLKSDLAELDTGTLSIGNRWKEPSCPFMGLMGIDRSGRNLVIGCKDSVIIEDPQAQKIVSSSGIGGVRGPMPVAFSPSLGDAFFEGLDQRDPRAELLIVHEDSSGQLDPAELVPQVFGRPAAFDEASQHFFVVHSDTKTVDSGLFIEAPGSGLTPLPVQEPVPGTYQILVYGRD